MNHPLLQRVRFGVSRGVLAMVLLILSGCATFAPQIDPPIVTVSRFQVLDVQLLEQRYALTLRIQNPNAFAIPIRGLSFQLSLYGVPFAHGVSDQALRIGPYTEGMMELTVVSGTLNLIKQLSRLQNQEAQNIDYVLSGHLSLEDRLTRVPFEQRGTINLNMMPPQGS